MEELDTINVSASDSYDHNDRDDPHGERYCIQPLNMRNIKTNRDWAGIFGNKRDEYR